MPEPAYFGDLAEHTGTLVTLLGFFALLTIGLIASIYKIVTKVAITLKTDILEMIQVLDKKIAAQASIVNICATRDEVMPELQKITERQLDLRQNILPRDYVRKDEMAAWTTTIQIGLKEITDRIDAVSRRLDSILGIKKDKTD